MKSSRGVTVLVIVAVICWSVDGAVSLADPLKVVQRCPRIPPNETVVADEAKFDASVASPQVADVLRYTFALYLPNWFTDDWGLDRLDLKSHMFELIDGEWVVCLFVSGESVLSFGAASVCTFSAEGPASGDIVKASLQLDLQNVIVRNAKMKLSCTAGSPAFGCSDTSTCATLLRSDLYVGSGSTPPVVDVKQWLLYTMRCSLTGYEALDGITGTFQTRAGSLFRNQFRFQLGTGANNKNLHRGGYGTFWYQLSGRQENHINLQRTENALMTVDLGDPSLCRRVDCPNVQTMFVIPPSIEQADNYDYFMTFTVSHSFRCFLSLAIRPIPQTSKIGLTGFGHCVLVATMISSLFL